MTKIFSRQITILTAALALFFLCLSPIPAPAADSAYQPLTPGAAGQDGRRTPIVRAIEKAQPAVVSVYAQISVRGGSPFARDPFQDEFFNRFFSDRWQPRARQGTSLGSGVIIDGARGLVVTNDHVVEGANSITVTLSDGREMPAEILGADPRYDLAVLKVKSPGALPELALAGSDDLMIGETVIAIGNPFGLSHTATTGVVSATGRTVPGGSGRAALNDLIQTDASINPGNSGGPLLNVNGDIIGINTAIHAQGEGLGFAIPSGQVKRIAARLMRGDDRISAALDLGLELAESGRPRRGETGCLIVDVKAGGPGATGGLRKGDLLMSLDGSPTSTIADYEMILSSLAPGRPVTAEVDRDGRKVNLTLSPKAISEAEALNLAWTLFGLKVNEKRDFLLLDRPADRSSAQSLGLREGDILLSFGGRDLAKKSDLAQAVLATRFQTAIPMAIQRGRTIYRTTITR